MVTASPSHSEGPVAREVLEDMAKALHRRLGLHEANTAIDCAAIVETFREVLVLAGWTPPRYWNQPRHNRPVQLTRAGARLLRALSKSADGTIAYHLAGAPQQVTKPMHASGWLRVGWRPSAVIEQEFYELTDEGRRELADYIRHHGEDW